MNAFLRHVMELRNAEQMAAAHLEAECRRCRVCGIAYRNLQKPVCGPCARKVETQTPNMRKHTQWTQPSPS